MEEYFNAALSCETKTCDTSIFDSPPHTVNDLIAPNEPAPTGVDQLNFGEKVVSWAKKNPLLAVAVLYIGYKVVK